MRKTDPSVRIELDKYILTSDKLQWTIEEKVKSKNRKTGEVKETIKAIKFYPTLDAALRGVLEMKLRNSTATSLQELRKELITIKKELTDTVQ
jgi:hypothetical protein